jgi:hypothetical protein
MKKFIFMFMALLTLAIPALAAEDIGIAPASEVVIDVGSFTGIVALVSMIATQILKVIPAIKENKLAKIGISVVVGIIVCMVCWVLQVSPILISMKWWVALLCGLAAGLSACGFYDIIKAIYSTIIKPDKSN